MRRRVHVIIFLVLCAVLWSLCVVQVLFFPKALEVTEAHVSPVASYNSTYKSSYAIRVPSGIRPSAGFGSMTAPALQVSMRSTSPGGSVAPMTVHATSSQSVCVVGSGGAGGGIATTTSGSSRNGSRGILYSQTSAMPQVQGLLTSASMVGGGVTATETYQRMTRAMRGSGPAKAPSLPDGVCEHCHWEYIGGQWICSECGANVLDGCECTNGGSYCWCPLDLNWGAMVFLMLLAAGYGVRARMREKCTMKENENRA